MKPLRVCLFGAVLATIAWALVMETQFKNYKTPTWPPPAGCGAPSAPYRVIADLELARSSERFACLIGQGAPAGVREHNLGVLAQNTYMDYLFIFLYWSTFVLFSWVNGGRLGVAVAAAITAAAGFDLCENSRLLGAVQSMQELRMDFHTPRAPSQGKWFFLGLATCLLAALLGRAAGLWNRLLVLLLAVAGVLTVIGTVLPQWLFPAMMLLLGGMVLALFLNWPWKASMHTGSRGHPY